MGVARTFQLVAFLAVMVCWHVQIKIVLLICLNHQCPVLFAKTNKQTKILKKGKSTWCNNPPDVMLHQMLWLAYIQTQGTWRDRPGGPVVFALSACMSTAGQPFVAVVFACFRQMTVCITALKFLQRQERPLARRLAVDDANAELRQCYCILSISKPAFL